MPGVIAILLIGDLLIITITFLHNDVLSGNDKLRLMNNIIFTIKTFIAINFSFFYFWVFMKKGQLAAAIACVSML